MPLASGIHPSHGFLMTGGQPAKISCPNILTEGGLHMPMYSQPALIRKLLSSFSVVINLGIIWETGWRDNL